jgi:hypothetical protein
VRERERERERERKRVAARERERRRQKEQEKRGGISEVYLAALRFSQGDRRSEQREVEALSTKPPCCL